MRIGFLDENRHQGVERRSRTEVNEEKSTGKRKWKDYDKPEDIKTGKGKLPCNHQIIKKS